MKVWNSDGEKGLKAYLMEDDAVMEKLSEDDLKEIFDYSFYTQNIDYIFDRTFN